ncbi:MAG: hypothetical protein H0U04_19760 [Rubrobacter sp.]|nr:hypothetical protein [Rubrobacter sp.]
MPDVSEPVLPDSRRVTRGPAGDRRELRRGARHDAGGQTHQEPAARGQPDGSTRPAHRGHRQPWRAGTAGGDFYFYDVPTLKKIGKALGLTGRRISQLLRRALEQLHGRLSDNSLVS